MMTKQTTTKQRATRQMAGLCVAALAWAIPAAAHAGAVVGDDDPDGIEEYASSVDKDLSALDGDWAGQTNAGIKVAMHFASAKGNLPLSGKWKIEGGAFAGETDLSVVHTGSLFFLVPEASPFAPVPPGKDSKDAYAMSRIPGGGFRFARLTHVEVGGQAAIQAEQILIGKKHSDGSRTLKLTTSDKLCADPSSPAGKVCAEAQTDQIVLRKVTL